MNFTIDYQQQYPRQPTTGFVLIRTHQAGIVAWVKSKKLTQPNHSQPNVSDGEKHLNYVDDDRNEY